MAMSGRPQPDAAAAALRLVEVAVNSITEMVSVVGEDEVYRMVNAAWCRTMGRSREETVGRSVTDLFGLTAPTARQQALHDCLASGRKQVVRGTSRLPHLAGRVLEATYTPYGADDAGVRCVVVVTRDVTDEERQHQALSTTSDYLGRTLDATGEGILASEPGQPDVPLRFYNQRLLDIWGIAKEMGPLLTPRRMVEHVTPLFSHPEAELARIQEIIDNNLSAVDRLELKDGRTLLRRCAAPIGPDKGVRVWSFRDITIEAQALQRLQAEEAETRALLEAFPGTIAVLDENLCYAFANDALLQRMGCSRDAVVGHSVDSVLGAERGRQVRELAARAMAEGAVVYDREFGGRTIQITMTGDIDRRSAKPRYHAFGVDITGLKNAERALIAARDDAERANRAKSQFLSHMSHELRTPLNAILGFAQVLDGDAALAPPQRAQAGEILRGARHLLTLINGMLDLGSIEAGKLALELAPMALRELVGECLALVEPLAREREVMLEPLDDRSVDHSVHGDRLRLKQVLLNLLANAIKYNRPRGIVSVRCSVQRKCVRLTVADNGPGLSAEQQERLFTPFERLHGPHAGVEGTGIGLALSRRLMQAMGGDIGVASAIGAGSRFWIELPLLTRRLEEGTAGNPAPTGPPPRGAKGARTVLYIEDNPVNVVLMEAMLMRVPGLTMLSETMPLPGIARAIAASPDLILLDIQLPGMSGFDVLKQLRASPATRRVPVIAVSANAMPEDVQAGRAAGFFDYLTKPVELATLLATIEAAFAATA